jgi:hypothetical protein
MNLNIIKFDGQTRQLCFVYFLFLSIFGASYGFWNAPFSYAMDNSLGLNFIRNFEQHSSYLAWLKSSKSLVHVIGSYGFFLGFNHDTLSTLFSTITSTIYVFGLGTIALLLIRDIKIASLTTIFLSIEPPFRLLETTYGLEAIASPHLSSLGAGLAFLTIGLYIAKRGILCNFVSFLNLSIHPILAIFPIMLISIDLLRNYIFKKKWPRVNISLSTILPIFFPIFCWAYYFIFVGKPDLFEVNQADFNHYIDVWDYHRNIEIKLTTIWIFVILAIALLLFRAFFTPQNLDRRLHSITLSFLAAAILVLALLPLLNLPILTELAEKLITGRFTAIFEPLMIIYAVALSRKILKKVIFQFKLNINFDLCFLGMCLFLTSLFLKFDLFTPYFQKKLASTSFHLTFSLTLLFILCLYFLIKENTYKKRKFCFSLKKWSTISFTLFMFSILSGTFIFENLIQQMHRQLTSYCPVSSSNTVALSSDSVGVIFFQRYCTKPVLLDVSSFDYIPYVPSASTSLRDEIEIIYGIDFKDENAPDSLSSGRFRDLWQDRSTKEWIEIAAKYNFSVISTPSHWNLKLEKVSGTNDLNIYSLNETTERLKK